MTSGEVSCLNSKGVPAKILHSVAFLVQSSRTHIKLKIGLTREIIQLRGIYLERPRNYRARMFWRSDSPG